MPLSKILPAALVAAMALSTVAAVIPAQAETEKSQEITTVLNARVSISQAIAAAEKAADGRAVRVDLEKRKGAYLYEIATVSKSGGRKVLIDPSSGKIVDSEREGPIGRLIDEFDREEVSGIDKSPTTLAAAVAVAERHAGGRAMEASYENEDGSAAFKIDVASGNAVKRVLVDPASGKVVKVLTRHDDDEDED